MLYAQERPRFSMVPSARVETIDRDGGADGSRPLSPALVGTCYLLWLWRYVAVYGVSVLDLGHAQIDSLKLSIADSSAILLSGGSLKKKHRY